MRLSLTGQWHKQLKTTYKNDLQRYIQLEAPGEHVQDSDIEVFLKKKLPDTNDWRRMRDYLYIHHIRKSLGQCPSVSTHIYIHQHLRN